MEFEPHLARSNSREAPEYDEFGVQCKCKCTCRFSRGVYALQMAKKTVQFDYIEPVGARVLVRKDEPKRETKGGIALPDAAEIPTITGRIITISRQVEHDDDVPLRQYDKILFHPKNAIPVDFEPDNQLYVVPVEDVVAVFRSKPPESKLD
jgi:chaperonin GroES